MASAGQRAYHGRANEGDSSAADLSCGKADRRMNSELTTMPILILYPHKSCNCRCVMCDIWKDRSAEEISFDRLQRHIEEIRQLRVKWVVLSGGEPLMHSDLFRLTELLRS